MFHTPFCIVCLILHGGKLFLGMFHVLYIASVFVKFFVSWYLPIYYHVSHPFYIVCLILHGGKLFLGMFHVLYIASVFVKFFVSWYLPIYFSFLFVCLYILVKVTFLFLKNILLLHMLIKQ